jgi:hypothetical protein
MRANYEPRQNKVLIKCPQESRGNTILRLPQLGRMSTDLVSRRLRLMLADWLSSNSVLREIENEFEAEGIPSKQDGTQNSGGQRRSMIQSYYNGLDFSDTRDIRRFLNVLSVFLREMERQASLRVHDRAAIAMHAVAKGKWNAAMPKI